MMDRDHSVGHRTFALTAFLHKIFGVVEFLVHEKEDEEEVRDFVRVGLPTKFSRQGHNSEWDT